MKCRTTDSQNSSYNQQNHILVSNKKYCNKNSMMADTTETHFLFIGNKIKMIVNRSNLNSVCKLVLNVLQTMLLM